MKNGGEQADLIIYNTEDGKTNVALYARDGMVWMSQKQLAELFDTSVANISIHISNIFKEQELDESAVVKDYLTTASDGKTYSVIYYCLEMILAIGFRVRSRRGTQFRLWANRNLKEYITKGFVLDDDRLKNPDRRPDYFDEMLARIRDIRASEKRFYQKVRELLALSSDYDPRDKSTQMFFADTQNKLLYAVTGQTAAELVTGRADPSQPNMGLTNWKGSIVRKQDIIVAKNYLTADEIDTLNRLVVIFLETAELRAKNRHDITMGFWRGNVQRILEANDFRVLGHKGAISRRQMSQQANRAYEQFDARRKQYDAQQADRQDVKVLEELQNNAEAFKRDRQGKEDRAAK